MFIDLWLNRCRVLLVSVNRWLGLGVCSYWNLGGNIVELVKLWCIVLCGCGVVVKGEGIFSVGIGLLCVR